MIKIPTFALCFQNFEPYFIPTILIEGTWKLEKTYVEDLVGKKLKVTKALAL